MTKKEKMIFDIPGIIVVNRFLDYVRLIQLVAPKFLKHKGDFVEKAREGIIKIGNMQIVWSNDARIKTIKVIDFTEKNI
jgi:hypothetical protein